VEGGDIATVHHDFSYYFKPTKQLKMLSFENPLLVTIIYAKQRNETKSG
jgi:hypothetical protein